MFGGNLEQEMARMSLTNATSDANALVSFLCEICCVNCTSQLDLEFHRGGKKHRNQIKKAGTLSENTISQANAVDSFSCGICSIDCTSHYNLECHMTGKRHCRQIKKLDGNLGKEAGTLSENTISQANAVDSFSCEICSIDCTSHYNLECHKMGKRHCRQIKKLDGNLGKEVGMSPENTTSGANAVGYFLCEICGIVCKSRCNLDSHTKGKRHSKQIKKLEIGGQRMMTEEKENQEDVEVEAENEKAETQRTTKVCGKRKAEDLKTKTEKMLQMGAPADGIRACSACNIVCNSQLLYVKHLAGKKHHRSISKKARIDVQD